MKTHVLALALFATLPPMFAGADPAPSAEAAATADGVWTLSTVGTKSGATNTVKKEQLTQKIALTFATKPGSKKVEISGKVFGHPITKSTVSEWKPGATVSFTTTYKLDTDYPIKWRAKVSPDGRSLTDGTFDFILGGGTFTATKG